MSVIPGEPTSPTDDLAAGVLATKDDSSQTLKSLGLRKLLVTLPLAIASFTVFWGAVQFILIPIQVQTIDPEGQAGSLALIVGIGAISSMIAAPIAGALSDRTRTRIGGRAPWMIVGAVATLLLAITLGFATTIPLIVVIVVAMQFTTNLILTPVSAYIPDRVPIAKRGVFSSVYGAAQLVGGVIGQTLGAGFAAAIPLGYIVVASILAGLVILFALTNIRSNIGEPRPKLSARIILSTFWVNPIAHPNFALTFFGRFLVFVGYFPLLTFQLYLLQDFIGLKGNAVDAIPVLGLASLIGQLAGAVFGGLIVQRLGRTKPIIFAASVILILGLIVPLLWPTMEGMIAYSALAGLGIGTYIAVDLVLITLVLPSANDAGKDLGIINITTTLPQTIGVVVGAIAVGVFGTYAALFPIAIVAVVVGAVLLKFIRGVK